MTPVDQVASLALFARVVHHRSFSAAAREAGLAKSAVSRRIAELERIARGPVAAPDHADAVADRGGSAGPRARPGAGRRGRRGAGGRRGRHRGRPGDAPAQRHRASSRSCTSPAPSSAFLALQPEVEVHLSTDDRLVDVVEGGFDVVFRIGRLTDSSLVARRLATDRLVVCASPAYLARAGTPRVPADLLRHACLHYALVPRAAEWRFRQGNARSRSPPGAPSPAPTGSASARRSWPGRGWRPSPRCWWRRTWRPGGSAWCSRGHGAPSSAFTRSPRTARRPRPASGRCSTSW